MARLRPPLRSQLNADDHYLNFLPSNDVELVLDWTRMAPGERAIVVDDDTRQLSGRVDVVTEDGSILWLQLDGGAGRRLFAHFDGWLVWRVPAPESLPDLVPADLSQLNITAAPGVIDLNNAPAGLF